MVLVDTSVWIRHFREKKHPLGMLLMKRQVICHPYVVGELACGNLKNRTEILSLLQRLPAAVSATHEEVLHFIDANRLMGIGLGYIDVQLLASAMLTSIPLWTADKKLNRVADQLRIAYSL